MVSAELQHVVATDRWNDGRRPRYATAACREPKILTKRVRDRDKMVAATSFLMLKGRIAQTLLELADHFGQDVGRGRIVIRQKIRQRDIAAMAGTARENVTRIINDWQRRKLVSRPSGYYCLENKALLEHQVKH